jgi:hypothetical protein
MSKRLSVAALAIAFAGCASVGQLTVKDYTSKSGQRVMAGQAAPKGEYGCQKMAQDRHDWGMAGTMNRTAAQERVTGEAVERAAARGANYAHVMPPSETSIGGININAAKDAQVAYYKCGALPAK